jgi:phage terminase small subunit
MRSTNTGCSVVGGLSNKQKAFVREYLIDLNATQAAIRAGYSQKTAKAIGHENLTKPDIQAAIQEAQKEAQKRAEVTLDDILNEYKRIAFSGMSKFLRVSPDGDPIVDLSACTPQDLDLLAEATVEDFTEGRGEDARDVRRIKIKPLDKMKALEVLGKHLGLADRSAEKQTDTLAAAIREINARGSAAPIATAQPDDEDE